MNALPNSADSIQTGGNSNYRQATYPELEKVNQFVATLIALVGLTCICAVIANASAFMGKKTGDSVNLQGRPISGILTEN